MDRCLLCVLYGATLIDRIASNVHDTTKGTRSNRYHDRRPCVGCLCSTYKSFRTVHSNTPDDILTQMLLDKVSSDFATDHILEVAYRDFQDQLLSSILCGQGIENGW